MSFWVVIPARLSSSRLLRKALADIKGKPMVVRVAEQAHKSQAQRVIVATDHDEIVQACARYGVETILTRPDHNSGTSRLAEVVQRLALPDDSVVVNVQGDEPMIPHELIDRLAQNLSTGNAPMATVAHPISDFADFTNPNCVKVVLNRAQQALYFSRATIPFPRDAMLAQQRTLPEQVHRHIGMYAYRAHFLKQYAQLSVSPLENIESLEQLRVLWHGYTIAVEVVAHAPEAGVDTAEDLQRVLAHWDRHEQ